MTPLFSACRVGLVLALFGAAPLLQAQFVPVTTTSDAARVHFTRGVAVMGNANFAGSVPHFDAALAADPQFASAHLYRAVATAQNRDEHMRRASAGNASAPERQMIDAQAAHLRGDHARERTLLAAVAGQYPNDPMAWLWLANTDMTQDNAAGAVAAAQRGLAADPSFAPLYNTLGYSEMRLGNVVAAEQAFRDYLRLAPGEPNPHDSYGEFLMLQDRMEEAEAQFEMALTKNPSFEVSRTNLARIGIERSNRRFEQAVAAGDADALAALYVENAIIMPPDSPPIQGRAAIRTYMAGLIASGVDGVDIQTVEVNRFDDVAIERADLTISAGGKVVEQGKSLVVWRLVDGEWLFVRDMWSGNGDAATGTH